jgi:NADH:ubiquinone reductase (H+-translocating)
VLWGAGMSASPLAGIMAQRTGAELDRGGRIKVEPDLSIKGYPEILLLGDMAHCVGADNQPLPGVAPVAMQQGRYVARLVAARLKGKELGPFKYVNKGNLAVIGRHAAVADLGFLRLAGYPAWLIWLFVHIAYLIEFDNKVIVLFQWAWNYFTRKRGARLITDEKK